MEDYAVITLTPENIQEEKLFCIKDAQASGFKCKKDWLIERIKEGLKIKILKNSSGKQIAFIEYIPGEYAWRPVQAKDYMFIHCMFVYAKSDKGKGIGSKLVEICEKEAKDLQKHGVAVMTSKGPWIASSQLFLKNDYEKVDQLGRFELMVKKFVPQAEDPKLIDWTKDHPAYQGWHLLYADQCPWHEKSVQALTEVAIEEGIELQVSKINSVREAQAAPSGFGVFSLLHDGKLLEDHYLSKTRFKTILRKEMS